MGSGVIQHGMQAVNPRLRMRWRHPKELPVHGLKRRLFQIRQHAEPFVGYCGEGTMVIRTVAATRAGWPIDRAVLQIGRQRVLERR